MRPPQRIFVSLIERGWDWEDAEVESSRIAEDLHDAEKDDRLTESLKENAMAEHKHAAILRGIAAGKSYQLQTGDKDTEEWLSISHGELLRMLSYDQPGMLREAPILINGIQVPAPETEVLDVGTAYYAPGFHYGGATIKHRWDGENMDIRLLQRGLVHLTEAAARAHAEALLSFFADPKELS